MAHNVDIGVFLIANTHINKNESMNWLKHVGANDFCSENFTAETEGAKTDADSLIEFAGRRCYMSFQPGLNKNVTKIRKDIAEYIENILKSGHGSVLEHATYTFAIEGVSRVFTGEMNRHRAGCAVSEGSMRYIRFDDIPYWTPISITEMASDTPEVARKKELSREVFKSAFSAAQEYYNQLNEIWKDELAPTSKFHAKKQITSMMRRIIPMGVATGGIWTLNLRALRHVIAMRTSEAAEEEICLVWSTVMKKIAELEPNFFGDFKQDENGFWSPIYKKV